MIDNEKKNIDIKVNNEGFFREILNSIIFDKVNIFIVYIKDRLWIDIRN